MSMPAAIPTPIPAAVVTMVVGCLLPLLLPATGGDLPQAQAAVLSLLAEYQPQTARELGLAARAVGDSLKGLALLAQSADPDATAERVNDALKWSCALARSGHQAQRRLEMLQKARRMASTMEAEAPGVSPPPAGDPAPADEPARPAACAGEPGPGARATPPDAPVPNGTATRPDVADSAAPAASDDVAEAEGALYAAETLLTVMKARYKGAPPPHSSAAQAIRAQQRTVDMARMTLRQARRRHAEAKGTETQGTEAQQAAAQEVAVRRAA